MKTFGRKVISKLTKSIRSRPSSFQNRGAVRKGILNARNPGSRGSDYVKKNSEHRSPEYRMAKLKIKSETHRAWLGWGYWLLFIIRSCPGWEGFRKYQYLRKT